MVDIKLRKICEYSIQNCNDEAGLGKLFLLLHFLQICSAKLGIYPVVVLEIEGGCVALEIPTLVHFFPC